MEEFSENEIRRYCRQLALPEVGPEGQKKIKSARVAIVGAGGLGSPAALYLAAAGVGEIGIIDNDTVEMANLQRQVIFSSAMQGRLKSECAAQRLSALNPDIKVVAHNERIDSSNALDILKPYDLVLDCSDNFTCRYLVNDACVLLGKPDISGSVYRFEGQVSVFDSRKGPCYRCLYPEPLPPGINGSCEEAGIIGAAPGIIGSIQALEALKIILGLGSPLTGKLLIFNGLETEFETVELRKNSDCPACGGNPSIKSLAEIKLPCGKKWKNIPSENISPEDLKSVMEKGGKITLLDVRYDWEHELCHIPGDTFIPLENLEKDSSGLEASSPVVIYCKDAGRSVKAFKILKKKGFKDVKILEGGIDAWAERVDGKMVRY